MSETVIVGCKLPNGLHLDLPDHPRITLNGANSSELINGYGITRDVPKAAFDAWMERYREYGPVAQGLIFAHKAEQNVRAEAKEKAKAKTGLEGLDPDKPAPGVTPAKVD